MNDVGVYDIGVSVPMQAHAEARGECQLPLSISALYT